MPPQRRKPEGQLDHVDRRYLDILPHRTGETRHPRGIPTVRELTTAVGLEPIGYAEARALGLRWYGPTKPCKRGHFDVRGFGKGCATCWLERRERQRTDPELRERERALQKVRDRRRDTRRKLEKLRDELEANGVFW